MKSLFRLYHISAILFRFGLDKLLPREGVFRLLRLLAYLHPERYHSDMRDLPRGERIRLALETLGPLFVKLGQTLSTRPDLVPPDIAYELCKLQDRVPPFDGKIARRTIEEQLGKPIEELFSSFEEEAMASASIAQVHAACLPQGQKVVVKVLRPHVHEQIKKDIALMYFMARWAQGSHLLRRLRPMEVVAEFEQTLSNELDLMNEAANATQFKANFKGSPLLYVPEIYWEYCRSKVMVQERIFATNIADDAALAAAGTNMKVLAERGVEIFFTQVFRDSFFHADMHPGNIFVDLSDPELPKYCAIDYGIVGALTPDDQHYLAENFLAFFNRDYRRVAELHIESGWVPRSTRVTDFEMAIRKVSEPIFGKPIKDISFGAFLFTLFQTARRFDMEIQPQLVLLQKTFFNVEGLGRHLYPELDLWTTAKPVLEAWMREQVGPRSALKQLRSNSHDYAKIFPKFPILMARALQRISEEPAATPPQTRLAAQMLSGVALLIAGVSLWLGLQPQHWTQLGALLLLALLGLYLLFDSKNVR